jgi:hypothetical protein
MVLMPGVPQSEVAITVNRHWRWTAVLQEVITLTTGFSPTLRGKALLKPILYAGTMLRFESCLFNIKLRSTASFMLLSTS